MRPDLAIVHRHAGLEILQRVARPGSRFLALPPVDPPSDATGWTRPKDYLDEAGAVKHEYEGARWVKTTAQMPVGDTSNLVETLALGGTSLWWFLEAPFYRFIFKHIAHHVAWSLAAVEREAPGRLIFLEDGSFFGASLRAVARARGIEALGLGGEARRAALVGPPAKLRVRRRAMFLRDLLRRALNPSAAASRLDHGINRNSGLKVLVASMQREQVGTDPLTGAPRTTDLILHPLLHNFEMRDDIHVTFLYKFPYAHRLRAPNGIAGRRSALRTWEAYVDGRARRLIWERERGLQALRRRLWASPDFQRLWTYQGVDLWPALSRPLERMWDWELRLAVRYMTIAVEVLRRERPDIVVVASETSLDNKALVVAARRAGVPVVAVQHGAIVAMDDYLVDFSALPQDLQGTPSKEWLYPDRFCISGEPTRRTLIDGIGYPFPERLVMTGQPRLDPLFEAERVFDRDRFCRAFHINPRKKLVLIGSQTFLIRGDREGFMRTVLGALSATEDLRGRVEIAVKPHPSENAAWHQRLARRMGVPVTVLPSNANVQEALYACDALVTFYSTIAVEAMILGRPVVIVNLTGRPDPSPYVREGAALGAYRAEDVGPALRSVLFDDDLRRALVARGRRFATGEIEGQGGASDRIVSVMLSVVRSNLPQTPAQQAEALT